MTFLNPRGQGSNRERGHSSRPLKLAVIREEFVVLTRDPLLAIVLNQLLYWTQRVKDFDLLLREEQAFNPKCNVAPRHGWIYKTADALIEETMLRVSRSTMRRYLSVLIEKGWVNERSNPIDKWNKTTQYRLNLRKLQNDLFVLGYALPGFSFLPEELSANFLESAELLKFQNETSRIQNETPVFQNQTSNVKNCSFYYRDYTETKNKEHTQNACELDETSIQWKTSQNDFHSFAPEFSIRKAPSETPYEAMVELWKAHIGQKRIHLTRKRKRQLAFLFSQFFKKSLLEWEKFCERIKTTPFLMGKGPNGWHISFDWILKVENFLKVFEGSYVNSETVEQEKQAILRENRDKEFMKILESIEDAQWKSWCTRLSQRCHENSWNSHAFLSLETLKDISNARFGEFDGRLVWIESEDSTILNRIEDLRLMILPIIKETYPNARNFRTREKSTPFKGRAIAPINQNFCEDLPLLNDERSGFLPNTAFGRGNNPHFLQPIPVQFENTQRGESHA